MIMISVADVNGETPYVAFVKDFDELVDQIDDTKARFIELNWPLRVAQGSITSYKVGRRVLVNLDNVEYITSWSGKYQLLDDEGKPIGGPVSAR